MDDDTSKVKDFSAILKEQICSVIFYYCSKFE